MLTACKDPHQIAWHPRMTFGFFSVNNTYRENTFLLGAVQIYSYQRQLFVEVIPAFL